MGRIISIISISVFLLYGCGTKDVIPSDHPPLLGSDRDEHGCIGSAGYIWCEHTYKCERPWELAKQKGFENTEKAFIDYCKKPRTR